MDKSNPKTEQDVAEGEYPVRSLAGVIFANSAYHCRPKDLWPQGYREMQPEWVEPIETYLRDFARPIRTIADELRCLACDLQVTGHHVGLQDWRIKNALSYDPDPKTSMEGRCGGCGYPCRLHHAIFMPNGGPLLVRLVPFPLFYHPHSTAKTN